MEIILNGKQIKVLDAECVPYRFPVPNAPIHVNPDTPKLDNHTVETHIATVGHATLGILHESVVEVAAHMLLSRCILNSPVPVFREKFPDVYAYGVFFSLGRFSNTLYLCAYLVDTADDYYMLKNLPSLKDVVYKWYTHYDEDELIIREDELLGNSDSV